MLGPAFRTTDAHDSGWSRWSTRGVRMLQPTRGVRSLEPLRGVGHQAAAFALALPGDVVFSHTTAARLWGIPLPRGLQADADLHIMRGAARAPIERTGTVSHRGLERRVIREVDGLRVTSLADTWCDLIAASHRWIHLRDVVMVGDAVVELLQPTRLRLETHPLAEPGTSDWWLDPVAAGCGVLLDRLRERRRFRGRRLALEAIQLVRPRVWSPAESHTRMVGVEVELPEPELNASIRYEGGGFVIGIGDLVWGRRKPARTRLVGEYQGRQSEGVGIHREEEASRAADNERCERMRSQGWTVMEIYSKDVYTDAGRGALATRLRSYLG